LERVPLIDDLSTSLLGFPLPAVRGGVSVGPALAIGRTAIVVARWFESAVAVSL